MPDTQLLTIDDLVVEFTTDDGTVYAVNGVSYAVGAGEIVGVIGESGSGKSVTAMAVLGLVREPPARIRSGRILLGGEDLRTVPKRRLRQVRGGEIAMVFQDPMTTLNPVMTVGQQIVEALRLHQPGMPKSAARAKAAQLLATVGMPNPEATAGRYPHELSGGMRQRVVIAMAMANGPKLLIADEPTTALDVTIQAQVLDLLRAARRETGAATILITHDLGVIAELADRVVVMYAGRVVEQAEVNDLFTAPWHPYTAGLLASLPGADHTDARLPFIPGTPPNMAAPPSGCAFHPRCPLARDRCNTERPELTHIEGRATACHFYDELAGVDAKTLFGGTE